MTNRVKVNVLGNNYTINTETPEPKIRKIEAQLSTQLNEFKERHPTLSTVDALVITSLNLMDYLDDVELSVDRMREQLTQYLEDAARARTEADDLNREVNLLKKELTLLKCQ